MEYWCKKVFAGEYAIAYRPETPPTVLDLGANCGAFSVWATQVWPGAIVHAYEPAQINYDYLKQNTETLPNVHIHKLAVLGPNTDKTKLFCGKENQGQASFFTDVNPLLDGTYELPDIIHPRDLPKADILKADTEGCEFEIILGMNQAGILPEVIMLEYHREFDRRAIDIELRDYDLVGSLAEQSHRGVVKYMRRQK